MPVPLEPYVRPIPRGVAKAVEATSDTVTLWFMSSEKILTAIAGRAGLSASAGPTRQLMARLIEMLGGLSSDSAANQPAVRAVLEAASKSPFGKPVAALVQEVRDTAGG